MSDECARKGKWIGGCRFEPRYDKEPADVGRLESFSGRDAGSFLEKMRRVTYVADVCTTCGKVVSRLDTHK